jgi:hypothetical protein
MKKLNLKTPQCISDLLKEIGELSCIFYLYSQLSGYGWSVHRNYNETGYDILLVNESTGKKIKIEVKTRQRIVSSSSQRNINTAHFTLTEVERKSADFLIAVWLEYNSFFIVPINDLKVTSSNKKKLYKFVVHVNKAGGFNPEAIKYLGKWENFLS